VAVADRVQEGFVPFRGGRTWYRSVAAGDEDEARLPLLCLHGGPGANWLHLKPYEALANERRVVFYDQLGSGNSGLEEPHEASIWTPELFVEEVGVVREALGLERVHILGHSWGGMLGMQYAAEQPEGLVSLIVESSPPSVPEWMPEVARLRSELPPDVDATLRRHEEAGTTDDPEYEQACLVFYARHLCRLDPWPDEVSRTFEKLAEDPTVYHTMNGPSEFHVIGSIRDWQSEDRLGEIDVPTLVVSGRHDEATPKLQEVLVAGIPQTEQVILEDSSHLPMWEERDRYMSVVRDWLRRND
jgi:L-proline amide hydrolase